MAAQNAFDPVNVELGGLQLIEASAGTGKTFNIAAVFLRLLIEQEHPLQARPLELSEILVVTFSEAATQELRERLRRQITEGRALVAALQRGDTLDEDAITAQIIRRAMTRRPLANIEQQLRLAARSLDQLSVFSIHGFCQRLLQEQAFECGSLFARGDIASDKALLREIVKDYWRQQVIAGELPAAERMLKSCESAKALLGRIKPLLGKDGARFLPNLTEAEHGEKLTWLKGALAKVNKEIPDQMKGSAVLLKKSLQEIVDQIDALPKTNDAYKDPKGHLDKIETWLNAAQPDTAPPGKINCFTKNGLAKPKRGFQKPEHAFFDKLQTVWDALLARKKLEKEIAELGKMRAPLDIRTAAERVEQELRRRKQQRRAYSFDDMITDVAAALRDEAGGARLAERVYHRYPYAMVDEFQDTDPQQYEIFRRAYLGRAGGGLMMIGDPKQAIYGFRGGDIFAYIRARHDAAARYSLPHNFRSVPRLITAVNSIFGHSSNSFLHGDIPFQPVTSPRDVSPKRRLYIDGVEPAAPLTCWLLESSEGELQGLSLPDDVDPALTARCVREIQRLLEAGLAQVSEQGKLRALAPGDIAVLTRTNKEAQKVKAALDRLRIPNVCQLTESVFASEDTHAVLAVLEACAEPTRPDLLRSALATELFGYTAGELDGLLLDQARLEQEAKRFHGYRETWIEHGVLAMLQPIVSTVSKRLRSTGQGQRRLTDLLHLGELLQEASDATFGLFGLIRWLRQQIQAADDDDAEEQEERQLRLENDDKLVQILTIHKSKGLQYPIVFAPFLGRDSLQLPSTTVCHDAEGELIVDLASPDQKQHKKQQAWEALGEKVRVAYVALTRAECRCYFAWGKIKNSHKSALAALLHERDGCTEENFAGSSGFSAFKELPEDAVRARLETISAESDGALELEALDVATIAEPLPPLRPDATAESQLEARELERRIFDPWWTYSFSQLAKLGRGSVKAPDFVLDEDEASDDEILSADPAEIPDKPRGAAFGDCVHAILERIDFAQSDAPPALNLIQQECAKAGYDAEQTGLVTLMVQNALTTTIALPCGDTLLLSDLPPQARCAEMEFYFPLNGTPVGELAAILSEHQSYRRGKEALSRIGSRWVGMMNGKIDLVFEHQGRYFIADYKTHALGSRYADYTPARLRQAAYSKQLDLQYLIYTVALHRHLKAQLPGYAYETHFGGALYLFVRAMTSSAPPGTGILYDRPPVELIERLDTLFDQSAGVKEAVA